jgi:flap endonuclease-1
MGVNLTPIIIKERVNLKDLGGKWIAVDANGELYQFLALIRKRDGSPLTDAQGRITSHLIGLLYRSTRLISDFGIKLVFVFDGKPPLLKKEEIERRQEVKERFLREYEAAKARGELAVAFSKSVMTSRLTPDMIEDAKNLLNLLGIPYVQAPGEGEAQAAFMAARGDVWAVGSKDYDSLLFGAPRLVRFMTISGKEFLPSKGKFRPLKPEVIQAETMLAHYGITREQLIDLAILVGTDFNRGIKGIGPKTALKLVKEYGAIEHLPPELRLKVDKNFNAVREVFLHPPVCEDYSLEYGPLEESGLYEFLCRARGFSAERVEMVIRRMKAAGESRVQA